MFHFSFVAPHFYVADGYRDAEFTTPRFLLQCFRRAGAQERQLKLAHRPFHTQQQAIVGMPRLVYTILIDDHRADQTAKLDQRVPVTPVAPQTRRLDGKHGTTAALADRRKKPLEARSADTRTRTAKIVIDDRHIRPAESASPFREAVLTPPALMIVGKLVGGGLPDVDEGAAPQMVRRDLHRFPPPQRRRPTSPLGARSPGATVSPDRTLLLAPVDPWARRGRAGDDPNADTACLSPSRRCSSRNKLCQASSSRRRSRRHANGRRGISLTIIAAARASVIQIGICASVPSGWRTVRVTSSPRRLRPVTMTVSPQRG